MIKDLSLKEPGYWSDPTTAVCVFWSKMDCVAHLHPAAFAPILCPTAIHSCSHSGHEETCSYLIISYGGRRDGEGGWREEGRGRREREGGEIGRKLRGRREEEGGGGRGRERREEGGGKTEEKRGRRKEEGEEGERGEGRAEEGGGKTLFRPLIRFEMLPNNLPELGLQKKQQLKVYCRIKMYHS